MRQTLLLLIFAYPFRSWELEGALNQRGGGLSVPGSWGVLLGEGIESVWGGGRISWGGGSRISGREGLESVCMCVGREVDQKDSFAAVGTFLFCAILKIWEPKSSSQIGASFSPDVFQLSSSKRAIIGCSRVEKSFFSSNGSKFAKECD